jgi:hypothetical protein
MEELKKLKIDPELRDLLPPLTGEEKTQLEKNLLNNGYDKNFPIITWNGFIVDGHNRYDICLKYNIEYIDRYISYETKEEVMSWMIDTQLGRRNLTPIQRIAVAERYKAKIKETAKANQGTRSDLLSERTESENIKQVETRKEIAKIAKVGSGTIARYDVVMKSDDKELKEKMLKEEIPITTAYDILKKKKEDTSANQITDIKNNVITDSKTTASTIQIKTDNIKEIIADMKIPKIADDYWNFMNEVECIQENFQDPIEAAFDILFERHDINGRVTEEERDIVIDCIQDVIDKLLELKDKLKNIKLKGDK